jgi:chromosome segregation ATPase
MLIEYKMSGIITSAFRGFRVIMASLGIGSSLGIAGYGAYFIVGGTIGGWAFVAMGGLCLIPSIVMLRDAASILEKIKAEGDRLAAENKKLEQSNVEYKGQNEILRQTTNELEKTKMEYAEQNLQYLDLLKENKVRLDNLDVIKGKIEIENNRLKTNIEKFNKENDVYVEENQELKENVDKINVLREQFKRENSELQISLKAADEKLAGLSIIKDLYAMENDRLHELITENSKQVYQLSTENITLHHTVEENDKQLAEMKIQVAKVKELHAESIKLLFNLKEVGDGFTKFGDVIESNVVDLTEITTDLREEMDYEIERFKKLNEGLTQQRIEELKHKLDANQDGIIDQGEFEKSRIKL